MLLRTLERYEFMNSIILKGVRVRYVGLISYLFQSTLYRAVELECVYVEQTLDAVSVNDCDITRGIVLLIIHSYDAQHVLRSILQTIDLVAGGISNCFALPISIVCSLTIHDVVVQRVAVTDSGCLKEIQ